MRRAAGLVAIVGALTGCDAILGVSDHGYVPPVADAGKDGGRDGGRDAGHDATVAKDSGARDSGRADVACPAGETACDGECVNLEDSSTSCGACGTPCAGTCYLGVCNGNAVVQVSMGGQHACARLANGDVWCWGANKVGEINADPNIPHPTAQRIPGLSHVAWVSAGLYHSCAVEQNGTVLCWGANFHGELGHTPSEMGDIACAGTYCNATPTEVPGLSASPGPGSVSIGKWTACALTATQTVWCWGWDGQGQLGNGQKVSFGDNPFPTPAVNLTTQKMMSVQVDMLPGDNVCALDETNQLWCWGNNEWGQLGHVPGTMGDQTGCGDGAEGTQTCNSSAQMVHLQSMGDASLALVTSIAPSWTTCASQTGGSLLCWGFGGSGGLGSGDLGHLTFPGLVPSLTDVSFVAGGQTMCALTMDGGVYCWGDLSGNEVLGGAGTTDAGCTSYAYAEAGCALTPQRVANLSATSLSASFGGAAAITVDGGLVAWGNNSTGQLGHPAGDLGDVNDMNPVPIQVQGLP